MINHISDSLGDIAYIMLSSEAVLAHHRRFGYYKILLARDIYFHKSRSDGAVFYLRPVQVTRG